MTEESRFNKKLTDGMLMQVNFDAARNFPNGSLFWMKRRRTDENNQIVIHSAEKIGDNQYRRRDMERPDNWARDPTNINQVSSRDMDYYTIYFEVDAVVDDDVGVKIGAGGMKRRRRSRKCKKKIKSRRKTRAIKRRSWRRRG
jgi:hypothetical protein